MNEVIGKIEVNVDIEVSKETGSTWWTRTPWDLFDWSLDESLKDIC
jgi:hypothetical protein